MTSLQGHNGNITSLHFSSSDQFLLSSSADRSCIVWNLKPGKKGEKLLTLDRVNRPRVSDMTPSTSSAASTASLAASSTKANNPEFPEQIRRAQFYNDDKIITVASGNKLYFYQYELPLNERMKDDVKRLQ